MKYVFVIAALLLVLSVQAQDRIVTVNGDTIDCRITKITSHYVHFDYSNMQRIVTHEYIAAMFYNGEWTNSYLTEKAAVDPNPAKQKSTEAEPVKPESDNEKEIESLMYASAAHPRLPSGMYDHPGYTAGMMIKQSGNLLLATVLVGVGGAAIGSFIGGNAGTVVVSLSGVTAVVCLIVAGAKLNTAGSMMMVDDAMRRRKEGL